MGWIVAAALVVVVAGISGFMIMSNIAQNNQIATETQQAIAMQQTDSAATSTSNAVTAISEETNVAAAIQETSVALTEAIIAQETNAAATIAQETNAAATIAQETNAAATIAQETNAAATIAQETNAAATIAQETSIAATIAQETNAAATSIQETNAAATIAQETSIAQTVDSQIVATENAIATATARIENVTSTPTITASPHPSNTPTLTPSNTPRPTNTPLPSLFIEDENDTEQLLLRYDGRSLVIANRDRANRIDLSDLVFILFEPDEDGNFVESTRFDLGSASFAEEASDMIPERCLQILDNTQFSALPTDNTLADTICGGRPFWLASSRTFWMSSNPNAYIEVRISPVDMIGRCETQRPQTRVEKLCALDLNVLR
jgi:hypothetical protein